MNSNTPPTKRSYTSDDKKRILESIGKIKRKIDLERLAILLYNKNMNLSINSNGAFFNLKHADDETLYEIELLLYNINKKKKKKVKKTDTDTEKYTYVPYSTDEFSEYNQQGYKLSNYEKGILKKHKYLSETISENDNNIIYKDYDPQTLSESADNSNSKK